MLTPQPSEVNPRNLGQRLFAAPKKH